jgi:flagellar assembly protein FliH
MSSNRILRENADVLPILWRAANGPGGVPSPPSVRTSNSQTSPFRALGGDPDAAHQRGYEEGRAAGEARAGELAGQLAEPVLTNFGAIVNQLASARKQARQEAEESMVKLALAIAKRILHRELATDPEAILGLVRSAIDRLDAREIHRLRMSPGDAQVAIDNRADMNLPKALEIIPDPSLGPGSAIFETTRGEFDVSAHTQLEEIERGFADMVHRRRLA